ncbi:hypothetical protein [Flavobacterium sp.]|uniref:hypothetical protein n=1 Tax=Flavobacterium sp. TaxID=239 RepID=UPI00391C77B0
MRTRLFLLVLFICLKGISQTTKLTLPNLKNEFEIKAEKNTNDGIDVFITDSKNNNVLQKVVIKKDDTSYKFATEVFNKIKSTTENYYFKLEKTDVVLKIAKSNLTSLTHDIFATAMSDNNMSEADFIKLLKSKTIFNSTSPTIKFEDYIKKITNQNEEIKIFTTNINFKFKRVSDNKIDLYDGNSVTSILDIKSEDDFYKKFYASYHTNANLEIIKSTLLPFEEYNRIVKTTDFNIDSNTLKLDEIYKQVSEKNDYTFINNFDIKHTDDTTKDFAVNIKQNFEQNFFLLKFCDKDYNCKITPKMPYDIDKSEFATKINNFIKQTLLDTNYEMKAEDLATLYVKVRNDNENRTIAEKTKEDKKQIADLIEKIENLEIQYSGILKLNKEIPVYQFLTSTEKKAFKETSKKDNKQLQENWHYKKIEDVRFVVTDTTTYIRFFNNKVKDILIKGHLSNNTTQKFRIMNVSNSFTLRSFNNSKHFLPISPNDNDAGGYYININDLFDYDNADKSWNYSVKNKEYSVEPGKAKKLEQRSLMDFFTGVIFSDVLGLNNDKANSLVQAEARIKVPLWIYSFGKYAFIHSLNADVNVSIYNGLDEKSRLITPINNNTSETVTSLTINNFDYIKYNNFNAGVGVSFFNLELKGLSTEWSFAYGIRYYRAGLRYTYEKDGGDILKDYQLNALTHELSTNLEIRPQLNFGADINFAFNWLNARGSTENIPIIFNADNDNDDKSVLRLQVNLYTKLNPDKSNDGIYARLGGFYHLGAKDFFPQVLVGYATNLSSFVNKFKK